MISFYGFIYASSKVASHDLYATFTFNYVSNPQPTPDLVVYETFDVTGRNEYVSSFFLVEKTERRDRGRRETVRDGSEERMGSRVEGEN